MSRLLVVEDCSDLAFGLQINLEQDGHVVVVVSTGADARYRVEEAEFDLVLLDLGLPDMPGLALLQQLHQMALDLPVMILSARADEIDRVTALRLGAVDYMVKPFGVLELLERVRLRARCDDLRDMGSRPGLIARSSTREVQHGRKVVQLTAKEYALFQPLSQAPMVTKIQLLTAVWKLPRGVHTKAIEFHIGRLRRKLADLGVTPCIRAVRGKGWALNATVIFSDADCSEQPIKSLDKPFLAQ